MRVKFFPLLALSLAALALLGGRCTPPTPPESVQDQQTESEAPALNETSEVLPAQVAGVAFVPYENKAMGYRLERPDKWYWRHYLANELTGKTEGVRDYFIADPAPLLPLGSEYLGRIVVEVPNGDMAKYASAVEGFTESDATVGGESAKRFEGVRDGNRMIEYQFTHGGSGFRVRYQAPENAGQESVFERLVASFSFGS